MQPPPPILELDSVTVETDQSYDSGVWNFSLQLKPGELALLRLEQGQPRLPVADVAEGMVEPDQGVVRFLGLDWTGLTPADAARQRGRIGRVFDGFGWVSDLDVDENILLAQRHHTDRTGADLTAEASALARMFGLPGLPRGRPSQVRRPDLQRAAFVRALMGKPQLLILERPTAGVFPEIMSPLINSIRATRARGAAVLWTTSEPGVWNNPGVRPTYKCAMSGAQMLVVNSDANIG